jgi:CHAT domain-containing protein/Tfp pilus assembly protein PilF
MRRVVVVFAFLALAVPVPAQEWPKPTAAGNQALEGLIRRSIAEGGLKEEQAPKSGATKLALGDPTQLKAAVGANRAVLTPALCDALVARWYESDDGQKTTLVALLRTVGEVGNDERTVAFAILCNAMWEMEQRNDPAAITLFEEAGRRFQACGEQAWQANCIECIGTVHAPRDHARALEAFQKALEIRRAVRGEWHPEVAASYDNIAVVYRADGVYAQALEAFQKALVIRRAVWGERHTYVADSYDKIAAVYYLWGDYKRALEAFQKALVIRRAMWGERYPNVGERDPSIAAGYHNVAHVCFVLGDYTRALVAQQEAMRISRDMWGEQHPTVAADYNGIANIYYEKGDYTRSLENYQKAMEIYLSVRGKLSPEVAQSYNNLAAFFHGQGNYARAMEDHQEALDIYRAVWGERHPDVATCYYGIATVYCDQGDYARALEAHQKALEIFRTVQGERHPDVAESYNAIAGVHFARGDYKRALDGFQKALEIRRAVYGERHHSVAASYNNIAAIYHNQGDNTRALECLQQSLEIYRDVKGERHPDVADSLNNIATVYCDQGDYTGALKSHQKALEILRAAFGEWHPGVAYSYNKIARVYRAQGDYARAVDSLDRALGALSTAFDPLALSDVAREGSRFRPLRLTVTVLKWRGAIRERILGSDPTASLRDCLRDYQTAAEVLEDLREQVITTVQSKLQHGETAADLFPLTVGVAARLAEAVRSPAGRLSAFAAAERGAARVFLEDLGRSRAAVVGHVDAKLLEEEAQLNARIRQLDGQIDKEQSRPLDKRSPETVHRLLDEKKARRDDLKGLVTRMEAAYPQYAALMHPNACSIDEARDCLAPDEVALLYVLGSEASYLIVVAKQDDPKTAGITIHKLPSDGKIAELVIALTQAKTLEDVESTRELGAEAYRVLLAPAAEAIRGKGLVMVPSRALGFLPFELLVEPAEGAKDGVAGGGRFLVEGHRIRYAPSMTALHFVRQWDEQRPRPERPLWAMGDPVYQPTDERLTARAEVAQETRYSEAKYHGGVPSAAFERLPSTGVEVEGLRRLWDAPAEAILVGPAATEAAVKTASASDTLAKYHYIHFATHGILRLADGTPPSLVLSLAGDQHGEDGFLTLGEVTGLRLNADLVVLSACQTGQGRLYKAEGVNGLARAFLYAGSRAVLCSLWRVDDEATAGLMADIYAGLKADQSAPEALRAAQLQRIAAGEPPLHWAPFILIGQ